MCQYVNAPIGYTVLLKDIAKLTHWQIVHYSFLYGFELNGVCHCHQSLSPVLIKLYPVE